MTDYYGMTAKEFAQRQKERFERGEISADMRPAPQPKPTPLGIAGDYDSLVSERLNGFALGPGK